VTIEKFVKFVSGPNLGVGEDQDRLEAVIKLSDPKFIRKVIPGLISLFTIEPGNQCLKIFDQPEIKFGFLARNQGCRRTIEMLFQSKLIREGGYDVRADQVNQKEKYAGFSKRNR